MAEAMGLDTRTPLAAYRCGLWTDDGTPAGSGYCITEAGRQALGQEKDQA